MVLISMVVLVGDIFKVDVMISGIVIVLIYVMSMCCRLSVSIWWCGRI